MRLKHSKERTEDRYLSISWFCFSVRVEPGIYTAVTSCSDWL